MVDGLFRRRTSLRNTNDRKRVALTRADQSGALTVVGKPDAALDLLRQRGLAHERARLKRLDPTWRVKGLAQPSHSELAYAAAWKATAAAMDEVGSLGQARLRVVHRKRQFLNW